MPLGDSESLGSLGVNVGADISDLDAALNQAVSDVQAAGAEMQGALSNLDIQPPSGLAQLPQDLRETASAAESASDGMSAFGAQLADLAGGLITMGALKQLAVDTAEAFGNLQRATLALEAISGDAKAADDAMANLHSEADQLGVSFDALATAQQKLAAIGEPLSQIPGILEAIANGAAAMNTSFDSASQRFDAIVNSGTLSARALTSLGLSVSDVAAAMEMSGESAKVVTASFKGIEDEATRAAVLTSALDDKFGGLASTLSDTVPGAWNKVKNAGTEALQQMGQDLDGFAGLIQVVTGTIKVLETAFLGLMIPLKLIADAVVLVVSAAVDAITHLGSAAADLVRGDFAGAKDELHNIVTTTGADLDNFVQNVVGHWTQSTAAIDKVWADATTSINKNTDGLPIHIDAVTKAVDTLRKEFQAASQDLAETKKAYDMGLASADDLAAAQNRVSAALAAMHPEWTATGVVIDKTSQAYKEAAAQAAALQSALDKTDKTLGGLATNYTAFINQMNTASGHGAAATMAEDFDQATKSISTMEKELLVLQQDWDGQNKNVEAHIKGLQLAITYYGQLRQAVLDAQIAESWEKANAAVESQSQAMSDIKAGLLTIGPILLAITNNIGNATAAMAQLGVETDKTYEDKAKKAAAAFAQIEQLNQNELDAGRITASELLAARVAYYQNDIAERTKADLAITSSEELGLERAKAQLALAMQDQVSLWDGMKTAVLKNMDSIFSATQQTFVSGMDNALFHSASFGDFFKNMCDTITQSVEKMVQQTVDVILNQLVGSALTSLKASILGVNDSTTTLGHTLSSVFGGGGGSSAGGAGAAGSALSGGSSAAGDAGSIGASISSGIVGMATAIGTIATAIEGIISIVQQAHENRVLGQIETNTRYTSLGITGPDGVADNMKVIRNTLTDSLGRLGDIETESFPNLMGDINDAANMIADLMRIGNQSLLNCKNILDKIQEAVYGQIGSLTSSGTAAPVSGGGSSSSTSVSLTVNAAPDMASIATAIIAQLALQGVHL